MPIHDREPSRSGMSVGLYTVITHPIGLVTRYIIHYIYDYALRGCDLGLA